MADQSQLEIINPEGQIEFYDLNPTKGITNIGRHPDNDIVIDSPGVALFQAVLNHAQKPFRIVVLSEAGQVIVGGERVSADVSRELHNWETIELDGYSLILLEGEASDERRDSFRHPPVQEQARELAPEQALVPQAAAVATFFYDQTDELIVTEMEEREWTVNVEETIACQITVINGGQIVAGFETRVEGLDQSWVQIAPPQTNLYEGGQAAVNILITPPRAPTSHAGAHPFAIVVTSPDYPGHVSRRGATLTISPYFEFAVSELSPRKQSVSWGKRTAQATLRISNKGNSVAPFLLEGEDDERACLFEFQVPGEETPLSKQAEFRLAADETASIPVHVTPTALKAFGLRGHLHSFSVKTTLSADKVQPTGEAVSRSVMGQVTSKPLLGPLHVLLIALLLAVLVVVITKPRILKDGFVVEPEIVQAGDEVTLRWRVSPFATDLTIDGFDGKIERGKNWVAVVPQPPGATYVLRADNLISKWFAPLGIKLGATSPQRRVLVLPLPPTIEDFKVGKGDAYEDRYIKYGNSIPIKWAVGGGAEQVTLRMGNTVEVIPLEQYVAERQVQLEKDTLFVLEAHNSSGSDLRSAMAYVVFPEIDYFEVDPATITAGEEVRLSWSVFGVDEVTIPPLPDKFPSQGEVVLKPTESTYYILTVPQGETEIKVMKEVTVLPAPEPTPLPQPPVIEFFTAVPDMVTQGQATDVQLAWSVKGDTTDIQITSLNSYNATQLKPKDIVNIKVSQPALLVLTASNGDLSTSTTVEIKTSEPTPMPSPTPILTPIITFFKAQGDKGFEQKVVFQSQQSGPVYVYKVDWNSKVVLSWETQNAELVTLNGESQPPAGQVTHTILVPGTYKLIARGSGLTAQATIQIQVSWVGIAGRVYLPIVMNQVRSHK